MLIQNQSKRTYQLSIGILEPLQVVEVEDSIGQILVDGYKGELVSLSVKKPEEKKEDKKPVKKAK